MTIADDFLHEELLSPLRPNGLMLGDNTLWSGAVVDASVDDGATKAIRAFNRHGGVGQPRREQFSPSATGSPSSISVE